MDASEMLTAQRDLEMLAKAHTIEGSPVRTISAAICYVGAAIVPLLFDIAQAIRRSD